jgi:hypothetical protein
MGNRVDCVVKSDRRSPWERIYRLGGTSDGDGSRWSCTHEECVSAIERGGHLYVDHPPGHRAYLVIATNSHGHKYVTTRSDGDEPETLLNPPDCR